MAWLGSLSAELAGRSAGDSAVSLSLWPFVLEEVRQSTPPHPQQSQGSQSMRMEATKTVIKPQSYKTWVLKAQDSAFPLFYWSKSAMQTISVFSN